MFQNQFTKGLNSICLKLRTIVVSEICYNGKAISLTVLSSDYNKIQIHNHLENLSPKKFKL